MSNLQGLAEVPMLKDSQEGMLRDSFGGVPVSGPPLPACALAQCFPACHCHRSSQGGSKSQIRKPQFTTAVERARLDVLVPPGAGMDIPSNATIKA